MRLSSQEAAAQFIRSHFPDCSVAILSGSVTTGRGTDRSDLDLIILDDTHERPFRASYREFGWPIEAFVFTKDTYRFMFEINQYQAIPSLQRMCVDGIVLKDDGTAERLIKDAADMLEEGPVPWTDEEIGQARYEISECLEDLEGSVSRDEDLFIVNRLATLVQEFELRVHGCWTGQGKWVVRSLNHYDATVCRRLLDALEGFYRTGGKEELIAFADRVMEPHGGRFFEGFRQDG